MVMVEDNDHLLNAADQVPLDDNLDDSNSVGDYPDDSCISYSVTYPTLMWLTENNQRFAEPERKQNGADIRGDGVERGMKLFAYELGQIRTEWSYVPLYEFGAEVRAPRHKILKSDLCNPRNILSGQNQTVKKNVPLYFGPLYDLASKNLLWFSDFTTSIDFCLTRIVDSVYTGVMKDSFDFEELTMDGYFEWEEFYESQKLLDSELLELGVVKDKLKQDNDRHCSAMLTLQWVCYSLRKNPDKWLSSEALIKLCMLRDYCNFSLMISVNTVFQVIAVLYRVLSTSKKHHIASNMFMPWLALVAP